MSTLLAKMVLCPWMQWLIWKYAWLQPQVELGCKISQLDIEWPHARPYPTDIFWTLPGCVQKLLSWKLNPLTVPLKLPIFLWNAIIEVCLVFFYLREKEWPLEHIHSPGSPFAAPCWPGWLLQCPVQEDQTPRLVSYVSIKLKVSSM